MVTKSWSWLSRYLQLFHCSKIISDDNHNHGAIFLNYTLALAFEYTLWVVVNLKINVQHLVDIFKYFLNYYFIELYCDCWPSRTNNYLCVTSRLCKLVYYTTNSVVIVNWCTDLYTIVTALCEINSVDTWRGTASTSCNLGYSLEKHFPGTCWTFSSSCTE